MEVQIELSGSLQELTNHATWYMANNMAKMN
jgi:hypothetical protein